ncbi:RNP-1 like RNA-binding protein [Syntrophobacter fumaroxidans MPOB]|uniref:RNP-1 like RNA-binding protein n=2 Tax=Syntrophobacter TaxID=29526 RepID=A0LI88_SYNFM|nr:RNP-1 like RNA-binding protein [Syntrophobacter fumaroxidans MPOB]
MNHKQRSAYASICVANMACNVTEDDLTALFPSSGKVPSANIVKEGHSGRSKKFGFVKMPSDSEADKAMKALNGKRLKDQPVEVSRAKLPANRSRRGPGYRRLRRFLANSR